MFERKTVDVPFLVPDKDLAKMIQEMRLWVLEKGADIEVIVAFPESRVRHGQVSKLRRSSGSGVLVTISTTADWEHLLRFFREFLKNGDEAGFVGG